MRGNGDSPDEYVMLVDGGDVLLEGEPLAAGGEADGQPADGAPTDYGDMQHLAEGAMLAVGGGGDGQPAKVAGAKI